MSLARRRMGTEENKALIRRLFQAIDEACKEGNANILDEFLARDRPVGADAATRQDSATGRSSVAPLLTRWGEQETSTLRATRSPNTTPWVCDPVSPNNPTNDHELAFQFKRELSDDAR